MYLRCKYLNTHSVLAIVNLVWSTAALREPFMYVCVCV